MIEPEVDNRVSADALYEIVLRISNRFLHNCRHFSIEILKLENPTYAEIAVLMKKVAVIIATLADDFDPMMGQKAHEYCELMHRIGIAIEQGDQIALEKYVRELDRRPGL